MSQKPKKVEEFQPDTGDPIADNLIAERYLALKHTYTDLLPEVHHSRTAHDEIAKAVAAYILTGSVAKTAAVTGLHAATIYRWKKESWWDALLSAIAKEERADLSRYIARNIRAAGDELEDRIRNGDKVLQGGKLYRVPMSGINLVKTFGILADKQTMLTSVDKLTSLTKKSQALTNVLADLAAAGRALRERTVGDNQQVTSALIDADQKDEE